LTAQDADFEDERVLEEMVERALEEGDFEEERSLEEGDFEDERSLEEGDFEDERALEEGDFEDERLFEETDMEERIFDVDVIPLNCSPKNKMFNAMFIYADGRDHLEDC
jgi:hypothetical protein